MQAYRLNISAKIMIFAVVRIDCRLFLETVGVRQFPKCKVFGVYAPKTLHPNNSKMPLPPLRGGIFELFSRHYIMLSEVRVKSFTLYTRTVSAERRFCLYLSIYTAVIHRRFENELFCIIVT